MNRDMEVKVIIESGHRHFDNSQYHDAMKCFLQALELKPEDEEAKMSYNQTIQMVVPRWHFAMLNDEGRNLAFDRAIRKIVDGSKTVLDIGTGSGLLSMMATRAGAKMVYACEMNQPIADLAKLITSANGYADKIKVIPKKSNDLVLGVDIPKKVDVLIIETIDSGLIGEGIIPLILHAKQNLLKENGDIIPKKAKIYGTLIESRQIYGLNRVKKASGFDVSLFNRLSTDGSYPIRLERFNHQFLCRSFEICEFNFMACQLRDQKINIPVEMTMNGLCHCVAYWFELFLEEETIFSTSPKNQNSHWKQAIQCFSEPIDIKADQKLMLSINKELTKFDFKLTPLSG